MNRHRILFLFLLALPLFAQERSFDRTLKVTGPVDLVVNTGAGSITVRSGGAGTVTVRGVVRPNEWGGFFGGSRRSPEENVKAILANPPIEQNGNSIRIGELHDEDLRRSVSISYEITAPPETQLRARSGSGHQEVSGLRGPVEAHTGSGGMRVAGVAGDVRLSTGSGGIEMHDIGGSIRAHTGSGGITGDRLGGLASLETRAKYEGKDLPLAGTGSVQKAAQPTGSAEIDVEAGSGHIRLTRIRGSLHARTGSGGVEAEGEQAGDWDLHSGSGGLEVRLPANAAFTFFGRTGSGGIRVQHQLTIQGEVARHQLRGTVHGGGYHLDMHSGSGGIRVEQQ